VAGYKGHITDIKFISHTHQQAIKMLMQEIKVVHKLCRARRLSYKILNFTEHKITYINNYRYNKALHSDPQRPQH